MDVVNVKEKDFYEQCLNEFEIEIARNLLDEKVLVSYETSCFSIYAPIGQVGQSSKLSFRVNLVQRGKLHYYYFEDTDRERIVEISIHEKKYARVVLVHKKMSERTKLYELQGVAVLSEVFPGKKYLSFGNAANNENTNVA